MTGLDQLLARPRPPRPGARVAVLCHHASLAADGRHVLEALLAKGDWDPVRIFTPEHGFQGTAAAGAPVPDGVHAPTGIPIRSLYGDTRIPPAEWLEDIDLVVTDLQDLGVRCYTYASTLFHVLRVCAETDTPVLVLDRPTPLRGVVDGPGLDPDCHSFVGRVPLPLVYGKSQGELATWLRETDPKLTGLELMVWSGDVGTPPSPPPPWIPPSPAIVSPEAAMAYPVTVWSEALPNVAVDRGGADSFQIWAMPDFPAGLDALDLPGTELRAGNFTNGDSRWPGVALRVRDQSEYRPVEAAVRLLHALIDRLGPDRFFRATGARPRFFDQLAGTASLREGLERGIPPEEIMREWPREEPN